VEGTRFVHHLLHQFVHNEPAKAGERTKYNEPAKAGERTKRT
jgi:hypothetical protein